MTSAETKSYQTALEIVKILCSKGFVAYFVGGYIRDLLLQQDTGDGDIDVATSASVEQIADLFPSSYFVGAAFGVVHVVIDEIAIEVATFRKDIGSVDGRHPERVEKASAKQDAFRRDFTINGMFYDPIKKQMIDYVEGQKDLEKKIVRFIGDPTIRIQEDRLRMLRAVRFAIRLGFTIEEKSYKAIAEHSQSLFPSVSMERVQEELRKMSRSLHFDKALQLLDALHLFELIFPQKHKITQAAWMHLSQSSCYLPLSLRLSQIFPEAPGIDSLHSLKMSNEQISMAQDYYAWQTMLQNKEIDKVAFVALLAKKRSSLVQSSIFVTLDEKRAEQIKALIEHLDPFVQRVCNQKPIVCAQDLKELGIPPSPLMGELLKEAEKISIEKDQHDRKAILKELQESSLWPK